MRKTNLRINNFFILEDKSKYYLSDIDLLDEWDQLSKKELKGFLEKDVTDKLKELLSTHDCNSNVNFIIDDFSKLERSLEGGKSPIKIIRFDNKTSLKVGG